MAKNQFSLLEACFDFKFHFSQSKTSLQAYISIKFYLLKSRTSLKAYMESWTSIFIFQSRELA